jgi:hypothetical protein
MSGFSEGAKDTALDALTVNQIKLHDGDPGSAGTANRVGDTNGIEAATFNAASSGERTVNADVEFTGLDPDQAVTFASAWNSSGDVFQGSSAVTGDQAANAAGAFTITTGSKFVINDPA